MLNKKIPMQAGMGGGSTDCANFIIAINKLFDLRMSQAEIEEVGKSLGADVVPCLYDGAALAEGIGDVITPIDACFKYYLVIIKPQMNCITKEMYKKLDENNLQKENDTTQIIIDGLRNKDISTISNGLYNSFEKVVPERALIEEIKAKLIQSGALGSLMTGSRLVCIWTLR